MTGIGIDDQKNDNIIAEAQDTLEEHVDIDNKDDNDNNNDVRITCLLYSDRKPNLWLFWKKQVFWILKQIKKPKMWL